MDSRQYREELIRRIVAAYKDIRRIDRRLKLKRFQKTFKNPLCETAVITDQERTELTSRRQDALDELYAAWSRLPEVRSETEGMEIMQSPLEFAAQCVAVPKTRKYMRNQRKFELTPVS